MKLKDPKVGSMPGNASRTGSQITHRILDELQGVSLAQESPRARIVTQGS